MREEKSHRLALRFYNFPEKRNVKIIHHSHSFVSLGPVRAADRGERLVSFRDEARRGGGAEARCYALAASQDSAGGAVRRRMNNNE